MILRVRATPNASHNELIGWEELPQIGKVLRIKIKSPPVDGKANKELRLFLATVLGVKKSSVRLVKGSRSRIKTFEVPTLSGKIKNL
ncbi:MAG: DUF167 domain-containing protein [Verrucomicrobiae bacterium]|nr:DUF167 domain-containing protein [Verrucomicrobiae bacterium]NNJ86372.1 DUF167 domain-containing protein [Akkermansiaceae bacterium]